MVIANAPIEFPGWVVAAAKGEDYIKVHNNVTPPPLLYLQIDPSYVRVSELLRYCSKVKECSSYLK